MSVCIHTHTHTHTRVCVCVCVYQYISTHTHTHTYIYRYIYVWRYIISIYIPPLRKQYQGRGAVEQEPEPFCRNPVHLQYKNRKERGLKL